MQRRMGRSLDIAYAHSSFLTFNFNALWCMALNNSHYTHFAMLHEDILPSAENWLTKLVRFADDDQADMISIVSPIKLEIGTTSTALARAGEFGNFRRLTMREAVTLPSVFGRAEMETLFGWSGENLLLVNTGAMVIRLNWRDVLEQMCFKVNNWIRKNKQGDYIAISEPEDWAFSREAHERGLKVMATAAIRLEHIDDEGKRYNNWEAWGT
jgi:hypothetical protein